MQIPQEKLSSYLLKIVKEFNNKCIDYQNRHHENNIYHSGLLQNGNDTTKLYNNFLESFDEFVNKITKIHRFIEESRNTTKSTFSENERLSNIDATLLREDSIMRISSTTLKEERMNQQSCVNKDRFNAFLCTDENIHNGNKKTACLSSNALKEENECFTPELKNIHLEVDTEQYEHYNDHSFSGERYDQLSFCSDSSIESIESDLTSDHSLMDERQYILDTYLKHLNYRMNCVRISREKLCEDIKNFFILHNRKIPLDNYSQYLHKDVISLLRNRKAQDYEQIVKRFKEIEKIQGFFRIPENYFFIKSYEDSKNTNYVPSVWNETNYEKSVHAVDLHNQSLNSSLLNENQSSLSLSGVLHRTSSYPKLNSPNFGSSDPVQQGSCYENEVVSSYGSGRMIVIEREEGKLKERLESPNFGSFKISNENGNDMNSNDDSCTLGNREASLPNMEYESNQRVSVSPFQSTEMISQTNEWRTSEVPASIERWNHQPSLGSTNSHSIKGEPIEHRSLLESGDELANSSTYIPVNETEQEINEEILCNNERKRERENTITEGQAENFLFPDNKLEVQKNEQSNNYGCNYTNIKISSPKESIFQNNTGLINVSVDDELYYAISSHETSSVRKEQVSMITNYEKGLAIHQETTLSVSEDGKENATTGNPEEFLNYDKEEKEWMEEYCDGNYSLYRSKQLKRRKDHILEILKRRSQQKKKQKNSSSDCESKEQIHIKENDILEDETNCDSIYSTMYLKVLYNPHKLEYEMESEIHFYEGQVLLNRYEVKKILSKTTFSITLKCLNLLYKRKQRIDEQDHRSCSNSDTIEKEFKYVCLKVMNHGKNYLDQGLFELFVFNILNNKENGKKEFHKNIIQLYDFFYYKERLVIVTEYMQCDLYKYYMKKKRLTTLGQLQILAKNILQGLDHIHSHNLIHCDLKPENIMINIKKRKKKQTRPEKKSNGEFSDSKQADNEMNSSSNSNKDSGIYQPINDPSKNNLILNNTIPMEKADLKELNFSGSEEKISSLNLSKTSIKNLRNCSKDEDETTNNDSVFSKDQFEKIKIIDFNSTMYENDKLEMYIQTKTYRAPEVLLKQNYDQKIDIWSLGCILFEIFTKHILFDYEHMSYFLYSICAYMGNFPFYMIFFSKINNIFTKHGLIILNKIVCRNGQELEGQPLNEKEDGDILFDSKDFMRLNPLHSSCQKAVSINNKTPFSYNNNTYGEVHYDICYPKNCNLMDNFKVSDLLFLDFLTYILQIDPKKRPRASEALQHPWLKPKLYVDGL